MDTNAWVTLLTFAVASVGVIGYAANQYFTGKRNSQSELEQYDGKLIKSLKENFEVMEKKVTDLLAEQDIHRKQIKSLQVENEIMTKIFQGRDETTQRFQVEGFKAMDLLAKSYTLLTTQNVNIERLVTALEKHLVVMESNPPATSGNKKVVVNT